MLTRHSLDLRLASDLELGREAREPHRPSMDGVSSFPAHTEEERTRRDAACFILHPAHSGGGGGAHELASIALLYDGTCAGAAPSQRHSGTNRFRTLQLFTAAERFEHDSFKGPIVCPLSHLCFSSQTQLRIQKTS